MSPCLRTILRQMPDNKCPWRRGATLAASPSDHHLMSPTRWRKRETNSVPSGRKLMRLRSRPEPFMHEKQAEEAPGQARPRRRMRSRNIPANSGPAVWSFIVQRADEAYPLRRSPEKQAEVWASDRFQDRPGRRAGPARRSRGSRRCTFPRCRRACARKC